MEQSNWLGAISRNCFNYRNGSNFNVVYIYTIYYLYAHCDTFSVF